MLRALSSLLAGLSLALAPATPVTRGEIAQPELTGAVMLRDNRLLLTASHGRQVFLLNDGPARFAGGNVKLGLSDFLSGKLDGQINVDDLQDVTWDGTGNAYAIASHARTPDGDTPETHYRLVRLRFDATGKLLDARHSDGLLLAIQNGIPFLADAMRRPPARAGLNIAGLAWDPRTNELVVGLRSPTVTESRPRPHGGQEDAVVLRIQNVDALFTGTPQAARLAPIVKVDLRGEGIHGMCYDPDRKGFWLVSGLSVAVGHPVQAPWALWFWDGAGEPREASLPTGVDLEHPSAVCRVEVDGKPRLLLLEGGTARSRYTVIPAPELKTNSGR